MLIGDMTVENEVLQDEMRYLYSNARQNYFYLSFGLKTAKNKMQ
jgi:hypothetical protein